MLKRQAFAVKSVLASTKCALVNARSIGTKTVTLRDFFLSQALDIMFIMETWTTAGESAVFTELLPTNCCFLNVPRTTGREGGVAVVFKDNMDIKQVSSVSYSSFKLCAFEFGHFGRFLCAVIYRPPKYNCDFITDISDFLANATVKYNKLLVVGDLNVHVCCPDKPMAKDFLDVIDSFNLIQHVTVPTQEHGHTLDLVLSSGFMVDNLEIGDTVFSDHCPVVFDFMISFDKPCTSVRSNWTPLQLEMEKLTRSFLTACSTVLDSVAPLKVLRPKRAVAEPWLNDITRAAKAECRRAERK